MRPALEGHAGIPQEVRLLFRGLCQLQDVQTEGLIQSGGRVLAPGLPAHGGERLLADEQVNRLSRVVVSLRPNAQPGKWEKFANLLRLGTAPAAMVARHLVGLSLPLGRFDAAHFKDFIWRSLFARTLPVEDFSVVTAAGFRVLTLPWSVLHGAGLVTRKLGRAVYPRLDTSDFDVMIVETPYPAMVAANTRLVVRYHDAVPMMMPHTIANRSYHQGAHYQALRLNVAQGAHFACVSDATRSDLVAMFPQTLDRSATIYNMVSHHYFAEESSVVRAAEIIHARLHQQVQTSANALDLLRPFIEAEHGSGALNYLLMVSTIEPRKNHSTLLAAWEQLRRERFAGLKLILVGSLGWEHDKIVAELRPWMERGETFMLEGVPSAELRVLYRHARATVCPSFGEGFDYSGVEAMRCGGAVVASDIPVHREVFGNAAEYFSPYSASEAAHAIGQVIDPALADRRVELVRNGAELSQRYLPERILPQWQRFLHRLRK